MQSSLPVVIRSVIAIGGVALAIGQLVVQIRGGSPSLPLVGLAGLMMAVIRPEDLDRLDPRQKP